MSSASERRSGEPVRSLSLAQYRDPNRGPFYVKVEDTPEKHHGKRVLKDSTGQRFIIAESL